MTAASAHNDEVTCKKCKSHQIVANKRGYSFKRMFLVFISLLVSGFILKQIGIALDPTRFIYGIGIILFFFSLPIGIISGFIGRTNILNGCMKCGNKWLAGN
jgi:hypothetical protein